MGDSGHYEPLRWPDERLKRAGGFSGKAPKAARAFARQVDERGPVPPEVWGDDPQRQAVAARIGEIIRPEFGSRQANFIPQDPFGILVWGGWYDLGEVEVLMNIEEAFDINIPDDDMSLLFERTLGEVIDYVMNRPVLPGRWPKFGKSALEARPCPEMTVFFDLRSFLRKKGVLADRRLRPSDRLGDFEPALPIESCCSYISHRFGAHVPLRRRTLRCLRPVVVWLVLTTVTSILMWLVLPLPVSGLIGLSLAVAVVLGDLVESRTHRLWPPGIETIADLVRFILQDRSRALQSLDGSAS